MVSKQTKSTRQMGVFLYPILLDETSEVGIMYGAKTTPPCILLTKREHWSTKARLTMLLLDVENTTYLMWPTHLRASKRKSDRARANKSLWVFCQVSLVSHLESHISFGDLDVLLLCKGIKGLFFDRECFCLRKGAMNELKIFEFCELLRVEQLIFSRNARVGLRIPELEERRRALHIVHKVLLQYFSKRRPFDVVEGCGLNPYFNIFWGDIVLIFCPLWARGILEEPFLFLTDFPAEFIGEPKVCRHEIFLF